MVTYLDVDVCHHIKYFHVYFMGVYCVPDMIIGIGSGSLLGGIGIGSGLLLGGGPKGA